MRHTPHLDERTRQFPIPLTRDLSTKMPTNQHKDISSIWDVLNLIKQLQLAARLMYFSLQQAYVCREVLRNDHLENIRVDGRTVLTRT